MSLDKREAERSVNRRMFGIWEVSDVWGSEAVWTEKGKGVGLLPKIFQHTEIRSKRAINKCSEGPSIELARTPGEYTGTEAPTKLSTGVLTMETIW